MAAAMVVSEFTDRFNQQERGRRAIKVKLDTRGTPFAPVCSIRLPPLGTSISRQVGVSFIRCGHVVMHRLGSEGACRARQVSLPSSDHRFPRCSSIFSFSKKATDTRVAKS